MAGCSNALQSGGELAKLEGEVLPVAPIESTTDHPLRGWDLTEYLEKYKGEVDGIQLSGYSSF